MRAKTKRLVRRLASLHGAESPIVSLYVDLDPGIAPDVNAKRRLIDSMLDEARRRARSTPETDERQVDADIAMVRAWVDEHPKLDDARGLAMFACAGQDVLEVVPMRAHVETTVHVGDSADLEPLLAAMADDSWCVLLVNRVHARILRGDRDRLRLVKKWSDPLPKRTEQGGWSQPQYQRHVDEGAKEHVRGACEAVFHELQRAPFDALAVVTTDELWAEVESGLHADLQRHLVGRVNADVEHSSEDEVLRAAGGVIEETERRREAAVLQELSDQMGAADRGATGLRDVLEALYGKRVDTLIVGRDFEAAGRVCASCGWIGVEGATCPSEGTPTAERADVVPDAIDAAIQQSADVVVLRHSSYEADGGPIAAILRY